MLLDGKWLSAGAQKILCVGWTTIALSSTSNILDSSDLNALIV
jgi:hypothetical protein